MFGLTLLLKLSERIPTFTPAPLTLYDDRAWGPFITASPWLVTEPVLTEYAVGSANRKPPSLDNLPSWLMGNNPATSRPFTFTSWPPSRLSATPSALEY